MAPRSCGDSSCVGPPSAKIVLAALGAVLAALLGSCRPDQVRHLLAFPLRAPAEARKTASSMELDPIEHKVDSDRARVAIGDARF